MEKDAYLRQIKSAGIKNIEAHQNCSAASLKEFSSNLNYIMKKKQTPFWYRGMDISHWNYEESPYLLDMSRSPYYIKSYESIDHRIRANNIHPFSNEYQRHIYEKANKANMSMGADSISRYLPGVAFYTEISLAVMKQTSIQPYMSWYTKICQSGMSSERIPVGVIARVNLLKTIRKIVIFSGCEQVIEGPLCNSEYELFLCCIDKRGNYWYIEYNKMSKLKVKMPEPRPYLNIYDQDDFDTKQNKKRWEEKTSVWIDQNRHLLYKHFISNEEFIQMVI